MRKSAPPGVLVSLALTLLAAVPVAGHKTHTAGPYQLTLGWGEEPAFTGSRNFVSVAIRDAAGAPLKDLPGSLNAEITFGSERTVLPLTPVPGRQGEFQAWLIPTRAGTYTFHITGKIKEQTVDITSTCSETTFDCVADATDLQFPAKDPSAGQLAERVARSSPRAERAIEVAERGRRMSYVALAMAGLALLVAVALGVRRSGLRQP